MAMGRGGAAAGSIRTLFEGGAAAGLDDARLLERFLGGPGGGSEAAFEGLVARHGPLVLGVCRGILAEPHDAQDAFQATFLILARKAGTIRRREALPSWLFGVARKVATRAKLDAARRRSRERFAALAASADRPAAGPDREPEDIAALLEEVDRLPPTYREPILLCYFGGMTYDAAARHLRCPAGTLSTRLNRARERLRSRLARRGLAVPAGLLLVGAAEASGAAPAPASMVRAASASGAVPAAVASLAERTMAMMRFRMATMALLALGGIGLAASASLAFPKPAEPPRAVPAPQASAAPVVVPPVASPWTRTLPNGATVELVGVSVHPAEPGTWRSPDGRPIPPPYDHAVGGLVHPLIGQKAREFAVRVSNLPEKLLISRWDLPNASSTASGRPHDAANQPTPGLQIIAITLPEDQKTGTVRFGVAAGPWKTEIRNGTNRTAHGRMKLSVIFGEAREEQGRVAVTVSHDQAEDALRLVAVDSDGVEHPPIRSSGSGVRDYFQRDAAFDLPIARFREFRLQSRPFQWAEFAGVVLD